MVQEKTQKAARQIALEEDIAEINSAINLKAAHYARQIVPLVQEAQVLVEMDSADQENI